MKPFAEISTRTWTALEDQLAGRPQRVALSESEKDDLADLLLMFMRAVADGASLSR